MKKIYFIIIVCLISITIKAQLATTFTINTNLNRMAISPYIYGSNGQSNDWDLNITARRLGGNRLTGYNWENNYSNAGVDYLNESDDYMPFIMNLPNNQYLVPNACLKAFHDTSLSMNCYSLITLPMAGYVARDGAGPVVQTDSAPSPSWRKVIDQKGSAFLLIPDTADGFVYVDECMNNLITQFGTASTGNGIKGYEMDNEWAIWNGTHPYLHPDQPMIGEVIGKSTLLSATIKGMDANAEVYGPVDYGYTSYLSFQFATDLSNYSVYGNFAYAYMNAMKHASDSVGHRLLDVYDVHWYSEASGPDSSNNQQNVYSGPNDRGVAIARMQAPRTLWDSSYVENSWIGQYYSPCVYIRALQYGIDTYNPGTKLAFTEFGYGGENHISSAIALTDVLGIFGRFGVYMSSVWGGINNYFTPAYQIYRNYDGSNSAFGDWHVDASTNDYTNSSVYSALQSSDTTHLHIIALNKNYDSTLVASFNIAANTTFDRADIYALTQADTLLHHIGTINNITNNQFNYTIPQLSIYHFVLTNSSLSSDNEMVKGDNQLIVSPNPSKGLYNLSFSNSESSIERVEVTDLIRRTLQNIGFTSSINQELFSTMIDIQAQSAGVYFVKLTTTEGVLVKKLIKE